MDEPVIRRKSVPPRFPADHSGEIMGRGGLHRDSGPHSVAWEGPTQIGRFAIRRPLGSGGMSVVYEGYDEELDRTVAIKLLRKRGRRGNARLQREAQALARLSHPNVVEIYEAGVHQGQAFIVMEQVPGDSLDRWLVTRPRRVEEIIAVFRQAGHGLAAAHAVGLVHRDFKPSNVLVGSDGRVRVFDFGLARPSGETIDGTDDSMSSGSMPRLLPIDLEVEGGRSNPWEGALTRTGAMLGTPAYMASEQFAGRRATAASDQFAFCVALYESLHGEHPFVERHHWERLPIHVMEGRLRDPPRGRGVPAALRRVLARGMATRPSARWPSMPALLEAIVAATRRRRRRMVGLAGVGVVVASLAVAWGTSVGSLPAHACPRADDELLIGAWGPDRKAQVRRAMLATNLPYAEDTWSKIEARLDDYAARWQDAHHRWCEAAERPERDEVSIASRRECLDRRRRELSLLVEVLAAADRAVVERAVAAVGQLEAIQACEDPERVGSPRSTDATPSGRHGEQRELLARALALQRAGKYREGLDRAEAVRIEAEALGDVPLQAEALLRVGTLHRYLGAFDQAELRLEQAYFLGKQVEHDEVCLEASLMLTYVIATLRQRPQDGLKWAKHAQVEAERDGGRRSRGSYLNTHATALWAALRYDDALAELQEALLIYQEQWGDQHPEVAAVLNNIGLLQLERGRPEEALGYIRRSLEIREHALGPEHPEVGKMLNNQGLVLAALGRDDEALASFARAHDLRRRVLGPEHPDVAKPLANIGGVLARQGHLDEAAEHFERALAIRERAHGPESVEAAAMHLELGGIRLAQGRPEDARRRLQRSVLALEEALGPNTVALALPLTGLANAERSLGRNDDALIHAQRGLALGHELLPWQLAPVRFALAQAQWERGDHVAALEQARRAQHGYATLGEVQRRFEAEAIAELDAWIAARVR